MKLAAHTSLVVLVVALGMSSVHAVTGSPLGNAKTTTKTAVEVRGTTPAVFSRILGFFRDYVETEEDAAEPAN
ncbi:hypothetical protein B0H19DRAFT_1250544 [Mycena capillaripes]|nr:hypothetical protein B0H19DRAFT_1250544 [Mycena capillaripes]